MTFEEIEKFSKTGFGWLTPTGILIPCELYKHKDVLLDNEEIMNKFPWIKDELENLDSIAESSNRMIEQGEHPEWHCWEIANDSLSYDIYTALIKEGYIRLGKTFDNDIEAEGHSNFISDRMQYLNTIIEKLNEVCHYNCRLRIKKV